MAERIELTEEYKERLVTELAVHGNRQIYDIFKKLGYNDVHAVVFQSIENQKIVDEIIKEYHRLNKIIQLEYSKMKDDDNHTRSYYEPLLMHESAIAVLLRIVKDVTGKDIQEILDSQEKE